jgi:hypothetical protein
MTFDEIINDYIREYRDDARAEICSFKKERSRSDAIRRAALCLLPDGKRHPHQCLIPKPLLELAEARLQAARKRLARAVDFESLHQVVEAEIGSIKGIGALTVYDIAHRIGAHLGKAPTLVYLHRGTRTGAAVLEFRGHTLDPTMLPAAFSRLTAAEIEDCLCIYKDELQGLRRKNHPSSSRCHTRA